MAENPNCMNICLGNGLITQVDKYAKKAGLRRDEAMQKLIEIAEFELARSKKSTTAWRTQHIDGEEYLTIDHSGFSIPISLGPLPTAPWYQGEIITDETT